MSILQNYMQEYTKGSTVLPIHIIEQNDNFVQFRGGKNDVLGEKRNFGLF